MISLLMENEYSDGFTKTRRVRVAAPASMSEADLEKWWDEVVSSETGCGHGRNEYLGFYYAATVTKADATFKDLVGQKRVLGCEGPHQS